MFGDLFAAGSGRSSWRSEMDVEDIWAGPAGRVGFQLRKMGEAALDRANALSKLDRGMIPSRVGRRRVCLGPAFIPSLSTWIL